MLHIVRGASARRVVDGDDTLLDAFVAGGETLAAQGVAGLITSCGFLAVEQSRLAARASVPVATSALLQIPLIARCLPMGRRVGVITYDAAALTPAHFTAVGADPATPVAGLPRGGAFHAMIERDALYDHGVLAQEVLTTVHSLLADHSQIGAIVLECTNLPPFSAAIAQATGLAVYDVITMGHWFHSGLVSRA